MSDRPPASNLHSRPATLMGGKCVVLRDNNEADVGFIWTDTPERKANAEYVLRACNSHEELLRRLTTARAFENHENRTGYSGEAPREAPRGLEEK